MLELIHWLATIWLAFCVLLALALVAYWYWLREHLPREQWIDDPELGDLMG